MDNQKNQPKVIKILQVGDLQIGKSCLYHRYSQGIYDAMNIGFDFFIQKFQIEGQEVKVQFWEYSEYIVESFLTSCYKTCPVIIISYDTTNRQSFEKVLFFYQDYNKKRENNMAALFLVGNKCDLEEERQVSYEEGKQLSESLGMLFMEVSAKEDYQVKELFEKIKYYAFYIY